MNAGTNQEYTFGESRLFPESSLNSGAMLGREVQRFFKAMS
jgi:hypothetical protein